MAIDPRVEKSMKIYERAAELIPGKTQLASRRASMYANGVSPVYATGAKGSRFTDVDGNEYIDWVNAYGAIVLGHADEVVNDAVKAQVDLGSIYTINSAMEVELAEELVDTIPSAEMVRFTKGGGDACAVAARIARGGTDREKILFSGYHGWHDWYQAANYLADPTTGGFPITGIEPIGIPKALKGTIIPFTDGDLGMLERLLEENAGEVAAIMMEPMGSSFPAEGYLEGVKALARAHGAVLIFDEVSCGWRIAIGGAQEHLGVTPDMTVVAKGISNGYPMGAVVGSRDVMQPSESMFISSSYWSDNIGLTASITTIRELKRRESPVRFKEIGDDLITTMNEAIDSVGISATFGGVYTLPTLNIDLPDESLRPKINTLFIQEMARRGVFCPVNFKATLAHTEEDVRQTAEAAKEVFKIIMSALEGNLDELLVVDVRREPFRRLVR